MVKGFDMQNYGGWEVVKQLGSGGQSDVYLVRSPARVTQREKCIQDLRAALDGDKRQEIAESIYTYARPDLPSELGALKVFKIPKEPFFSPPPVAGPERSEKSEAIERFRKEVTVLRQNRRGLPKLLACDVDKYWMVTELFEEGSLERNITKYKGDAVSALHAFRSIVETVAALHAEGYVHRDIKPANVFIRNHTELVLGDFGIVYAPSEGERVTVTNERVGPRTYMPPWADEGERLEFVKPSFDVYMLGKLLWCMIDGRLKLPRERHRDPQFDLSLKFPDSRQKMLVVNSILDRCIVEKESSCLPSAQELLTIVDEGLTAIAKHQPILMDGKLELPCHVCGRGRYREYLSHMKLGYTDKSNFQAGPIVFRLFVCTVCANYQFFAPNFPEEAASRGWKETV